jgi:hypothetical protein
MAPFESQMAAQRGLMPDAGLGVGAGQPESLMHHSLAMMPGQNRKSFIQPSLSYDPTTLSWVGGLLDLKLGSNLACRLSINQVIMILILQ